MARRPVPEIPRELRGIWVTRFTWTNKDPEAMRLGIIRIMEQIAQANFNAVFFQVRGAAETLYPSPIETWSRLLDEKDPGFDPVALAIREAHCHGLTFYAYINLLPLYAGETPPKDSTHLYYRHGPLVGTDSCWVCFSQDDKPMALNEYYYLNPALPQVKHYLKRVIRHFVETYDVDGLHFDRIRYPGAEYISDPYSIRQFQIDSLDTPVTLGQWARHQLTDLVEDVVTEALLIKPYLHMSAATWGLYRTKDIAGYEHFGSGYARYYQDAIDWLDRSIMDFIVPMIYWDIPEPKPNFHQLWDDFRTRTPNYRAIFPGLRVRSNWLTNGETANQVRYTRQHEGTGHVMFSLASFQQGTELDYVKEILYPNKVTLPRGMKRNHPTRVVSLRLDAQDPIPLTTKDVRIEPFSLNKTVDSEGWWGMILPSLVDSLSIISGQQSIPLHTREWKPPYRYVIESDSSVNRQWPWVEFRKSPADTTTQPTFDLLCKSEYPAYTFINDDSVKMYKTGIFFNKLTFTEGRNRVTARVIGPDSTNAVYEQEIVYNKVDAIRDPFPLWIDPKSVEPSIDHTLLAEDNIRIRFMGSKGQKAFAQIRPTKNKIPLSRKDYGDYSLYQGDLHLSSLKKDKAHHITIHLEPVSSKSRRQQMRYPIETKLVVQNPEHFPLVKTNRSDVLMTHNLGPIRLGGPIIGEYGPGIVLQVSGEIGDHYRIHLNRNETGFIRRENVEVLPRDHVRPSYYIRSLHVSPYDNMDIVSIPYHEAVPYAVIPEPDQSRIKISLYGVKTSSTWITHLDSLRMVKRVTWQQVTPETYQVIIHLKTPKIWGYEVIPKGSVLQCRVKYPPDLTCDSTGLSLKGVKIAIEAGHGGHNLGAVGLSGLPEKSVNLHVARELEKICLANGMEVIQVRDMDTYMLLSEKRNKIEGSDADLMVSIHANAGSGRGGYLRVSGTSTYYHNPFWAEFAEIMYRNLLELPLNEFGTVGSFNYRVIRLASCPAILVEQAFMDHAEDEERLASPEFRRKMAQKIFKGIFEYIKYLTAD